MVQINSVVRTGSTGRIVSAIERTAHAKQHEVLTGYGRGSTDRSGNLKIGGSTDFVRHLATSFLFDGHGLGSEFATQKFVQEIEEWQPDGIALHNIHGYFLHYPTLFSFLKRINIPVVWTLHDCWPFTGHCSYFDRFECSKWELQCFECPMTRYYPSSLIDRSRRNFVLKKEVFSDVENLTIVTPSQWLQRLVERSFLSPYPVRTIHNGVDLSRFKPVENAATEKVVLGVANVWSARKGLDDFIRLRQVLPMSFRIVLIGVSKSQMRRLPPGIEGIGRTESVEELVQWYGRSAVFVNPTYSDNFPTTNIESLACGTPVVTYETGGSPESVDNDTGRIVPPGDIMRLADAVSEMCHADRETLRAKCRARAKLLFDEQVRYAEYMDLVEFLVEEHSEKVELGLSE